MIPISHRAIFRSRWLALFWAAGIIWFAVDVAGTPEDSGNAAQDNSVDQAIAALDKIK